MILDVIAEDPLPSRESSSINVDINLLNTSIGMTQVLVQ